MAKRGNKYQKATELPLVAVDLGSNGVRAMAAQRVGDGLFRILGVEECNEKPRAVEAGVVRQSVDTGFAINKVLTLLANRIGVGEIPSAFCSVGGHSMGVVEVMAKRDQVRKREIPATMLEALEEECKKKIENKYPQLAVLGIVPSFYVLDGVRQEEVSERQSATVLEGHYNAFYGNKAIDANLRKSFLQAKKVVESLFPRPDVLLSLFAAEDGSQILDEGCAVLDMGHETTTLTVYKAGEYICNEVVAQGGAHITHYLQQQGVSAKTAELLKTQYGYASPEQVEKNVTMRIPAAPEFGGYFSLTSEQLAETIAQKLDEILSPLLAKLNTYAGRIRTLYITGGGSMLRGVDDYIQRRTSISVRYGGHDLLLTADTAEQYLEPTYASLVGTILLGQDYRDRHQDRVIKGAENLLGETKKKLIDLFSEQE